MSDTVLAFEASGTIVGLVLPALMERDATVGGFVKDEADAHEARANRETETGALVDDRAREGVSGVFHTASSFEDVAVDETARL